MLCRRCGHENRDGASYCQSCGSRLSTTLCSGCGNDLPTDARFCDSCGAPAVSQAGPLTPVGSALTPEQMAETLEFLSDVPIFDGLRSDVLELMAYRMRFVSLVEGPIIKESEPPDGLYVIKSGIVKVTKSAQAEGVEATLAILRGGDNFGEMSLIDGLPHSADVAAMQPVECYFLGRDDFMAALSRHAELARGILKAAVGMVRNADEWVARTI